MLADPRSMELWDLLQRERDITSPTTQDLINARKNAEKILGPDENLFRMDWVRTIPPPSLSCLHIPVP